MLNNLSSSIPVQEISCGRPETLLFHTDYQKIFTNNGFNTFNAIWDLIRGETVKKINGRSVMRFSLDDPILPGSKKYFYIKKHEQCFRGGGKVKNFFMGIFFTSEGKKEFDFLSRFRQNGLATATPVSMGEQFVNRNITRSFVITEDFHPYCSLEEIIRKKPEILRGETNREKRKNILRAIALYARRMHQHGFNHRDFNATHVLLLNYETPEPDVALFDLQRVDRNPLQKFRWPIKTLAELNYTLPREIFSDNDRLFLFKTYKQINTLNLINKLHWLWVLSKTKKIARHTMKLEARRARDNSFFRKS